MIDINFHEQVTHLHTLYIIFNLYFPFILNEIDDEDGLLVRGLT